MNRYFFVARAPTGNKVKGYMTLEDELELKDIMQNHNYQLLKFKIKKKKDELFTSSKITKKDLIDLCEKLNMLLKTGISLTSSLDLVSESINKKKFKDIIVDVSNQVKKGKTFSTALFEYKKHFPDFFRTMIGLGENSGRLIDILDYIIAYYNYELKIKKKVLSSLFYPCFLLVLSVVVIIVVSVVIIPTFTSIFNQMNVKIPSITRFIISASHFISNNILMIVLSIIGLILCLVLYFNTKKGKFVRDKLKIRFPIIRKFYMNNMVVKFSKCLQIMIVSGTSPVISLQTTANLINNLYMEEELLFAIDEVKRGQSISTALNSLNIFPNLVIQTLMISEQTSSLAHSLEILANIYEEESKNKLNKITTIIEPFFILFISGFVVLLIAAIFIPLMSMLDNIGVF